MEEMPFIKIPLHGKYGEGKFTLVDGDYDGEYFSQFKWYLSNTGYPIRSDGHGKKGRTLMLLHMEVLNTPSPFKNAVRDHIDGDPLNNRSCNLEWVTRHRNFLKSKKLIARHKIVYSYK